MISSNVTRTCLAAASCAALLASLFPSGARAATPRAAEPYVRLEAAAFTAGDGAARLSLGEPRDLPTGAAKRVGIAYTLAAADLDGDGVPDVAVGSGLDTGGVVSIAAGDGRGGFRAARTLGVPESVELLATGDFDGDGRTDLAAAARGGHIVYVLRGDGRGRFARAESVALPGGASALAAGEIGRRDGVTDLAVAVPDGVLVFSKLGVGPAELATPAPGASLAIADVDGDGLADLAVAAGSDLVVAFGGQSGPGDTVTTRLDQSAVALAEGQLADGASLAILTESGQVVVPVRGDRATLSTRQIGSLPGATGLVTADLSTADADDLVALGGAGELRMLSTAKSSTVEITAPIDAPVAAVSARLNGDAIADLVVLAGNRVRVVPSAAAATFAVTTTNDSGDGSLRKAIEDANASPGADAIVFALPSSNVNTITPLSALPAITDAVTIDGYTQAGSKPNIAQVGIEAGLNVEIAGDGLVAEGLTINASSVLVRGLVINGFAKSDVANGGDAVVISGNPETTNVVVEGCFIGTDATGKRAKPNARSGVLVSSVSRATIGGANPASRNLISGYGDLGVALIDAVSLSVVANNYIGTDISGDTTLAPGQLGIGLFDASRANTIGGAAPGAGNVIAGGSEGLRLSGFETSFNTVQGNLIGTNATGTQALGQRDTAVVVLNGASDNTILGNVISACAVDGLAIVGEGTDRTLVESNAIGTDASGALDLGNGNVGVLVSGSQSTISENTIAFNGNGGVIVAGGTGNQIRRGAIFANGGLGIDLADDGPTANDPRDADDGANRLQNSPVVTSVEAKGDTITTFGTLESTPNTSFVVSVYVADASGQAKRFVGEVGASTDANGLLTFGVFGDGIAPGSVTAVTATATNEATDDTSELAAPFVLRARRRHLRDLDR